MYPSGLAEPHTKEGPTITAPVMADAFGARAQGVEMEDGVQRGPLQGLFSQLSPTNLPSFDEATAPLIAKYPHLERLCKMAKKKAKKVKNYPHMSLDKKATATFYSMEDEPPENSPVCHHE